MIFDSKAEIFGWVIAIIGVAIMGIIAFTGPYHKVNKVAARSAYQPITVHIVTYPKTIGRYVPGHVTVHVGQEVVFQNISNADHTVTETNNKFNSGNIGRLATWQFIPKRPGSFHYYCMYHPYMKGTLTIVR